MRPWAVATVLAAAASVSPARAADPATVTTHATARDRLPNTIADVQLSVESHARTLADVRTALAQASPPLLAYLRDAGAERLSTESVTVQPELDTAVSGRPPRITGYVGQLTTRFQVESGKLGAVLTDALAKGANTIDQVSLHPRQSELDGARDRLAAAATKLALNQARAVAEAAGRQPGPLRSVVVSGADSPAALAMPAPMMMARAAPAPPPPPMATEAGDSEVTASVTVVLTLAEP